MKKKIFLDKTEGEFAQFFKSPYLYTFSWKICPNSSDIFLSLTS